MGGGGRVSGRGGGGGEGESDDYKVRHDHLHTIPYREQGPTQQRNAAGTIAYGQDNSTSR